MEPQLSQLPDVYTPPPAFWQKKWFLIAAGSLILLFLAGGIIFYLSQPKKVALIPSPNPSNGPKLVFAAPLLNAASVNTKLSNSPVSCPLPNSFCKDKTLFKDGILTANLKKGARVLAAFDGEALGLTSYHPNTDGSQESFSLIILTNEEAGLIAYYSLKGQTVQKKSVKAGDEIGTSSGQPIIFKNNKSFIFELLKSDGKETKQVLLSEREFK